MIDLVAGPIGVTDVFRAHSNSYALPTGGFIVVWDTPERTIAGRIYAANGQPAGDEFPIAGDSQNPSIESSVSKPHVAVLVDGSIVVTYEQFKFSGSDIHAQKIDLDGQRIGGPVLLHTLNQQSGEGAQIVPLADGGFALSIQQFDGNGQGIVTRHYDANGTPSHALADVNITTQGAQNFADSANGPAGGHVVSWAAENVDGASFAVMMRVFNADGTAQTSELQVNQSTAGNQNAPSVTYLSDGRILIAWHSIESSALYKVVARVFNADGSPASDEFIVDTGPSPRLYPDVVGLETGGFLIAWQNAGLDQIVATVYDADAQQIIAPRGITSDLAEDPTEPEIVTLGGNRFMMNWQDFKGTTLPIELSVFTTNQSTNGDDIFTGSDVDDVFAGLDGDDTIMSSLGDDTLDGGAGIDTAIYTGPQSSFTLSISATEMTLSDRRADGLGTDTVTDIEFLDFDSNIFGSPFDLVKFAGLQNLSAAEFESFVELYIAYFNRAPDAVGLNFWGTAFANGTSLAEMAALFIDQDETRAVYPQTLSNADFATAVYDNVLGRIPDQAGFDFWVGVLDDGSVGKDVFILSVLEGAKAPPPDGASQDFIQQQQADRKYLTDKTDIGGYFAVHKGMSNLSNATAAMSLFDGTQSGLDASVSAIDGFYVDALDAANGEFLMPLIGVLDAPFG